MEEETPESPLRPPSKDKADRSRLDGVVDELKSVLAGLGNEPQDVPADPISAIDNDIAAPNIAESSHKNGAPLASDADFWSGNVLGWPAPGAMDFSEPPGAKNPMADIPEDVAPAPLMEPPKAEAPIFDSPFEEPESPAMPPPPAKMPPESPPVMHAPEPQPEELDVNPFDPFALPQATEAPPPLDILNEAPVPTPAPPAAAVPPPPAPSVPSQPAEQEQEPQTPWTMLRPSANTPVTVGAVSNGPMLDEELPEPPVSPLDAAFHENVVEPAPVDAAPAEAPVPTSDLPPPPVPIPGTIHKRPAPEPKETTDNLDFELTAAKPENLMQIACLFPEGQEKQGQQFVMRLREAGDRTGTCEFQAVFVNAWTPDNLDVPSWKKSASLSGADVLFVLAPRAQSNMFTGLRATAGDNLKTRLVYLEQIPMKTLYADILVQLKRGTNG